MIDPNEELDELRDRLDRFYRFLEDHTSTKAAYLFDSDQHREVGNMMTSVILDYFDVLFFEYIDE